MRPLTPALRPELASTLARSGLIIAEHPPGARVRRWHCAARSRLLAGLADSMLVVEAEQHSVDLSGPRFAARLGRRLCAVPGRISAPTSAGTHALIRERAQLVRSAEQVLDHLHLDDPAGRSPRGVGAGAQQAPAPNRSSRLSADAKSVLGQIARGAECRDALLALGIPAQTLLCALGELEVAGLLERSAGGRLLPALDGAGSGARRAGPCRHGA